jgi:3-oxoacyl-[acyl-carrier-protein] synthase III
VLRNEWFGDTIARKFVHHTGIESRPISLEDEVTMGLRAVRNLQRTIRCRLQDCAALLFVSPSFVPLGVARRYLHPRRAEQERLHRAARQLSRRLGLTHCRATGLNWFCSGYSRAMTVATHRLVPRLGLGTEQYVLVVTVSRISRITDFGCKQTGPLFGDMATVTLLSRTESQRYPVHFEMLYADARKQAVDAPYFDFHLRQNVPLPKVDGGTDRAAERLVFSLDGMGIADAAPRAMSGAVAQALEATRLRPDDLRFVVPHQAGAGIVRLTGMKLDALGIRAELINGLTRQVGNVSSCSVPYALQQTWNRLNGTIACPTAAVGSPGQAEVSQGCILLRSTPLHERRTQVAA